MRPVSRLLLLPLLVVTGCSFSSPYMRPIEIAPPLAPEPGQALVVFVRPSGFAGLIGANILDENGRFLGDSMASSYFTVAVAPGRHLFAVWAENTDALIADLRPGRTYFIEVAPTMGAFSARVHLKAIKPGQASWERRDEWLRSSQPLAPDVAAGQANLDRRPGDVAERMRRAHERLSRFDAGELVVHSLGPDDGVGG